MRFLKYIMLITALTLINCNSVEFKSPSGQIIMLGDSESVCEKSESFGQWYLLYGTIPLNMPNSETMFTEEYKTYRVKINSTGFDFFVSTVVCFFTSITRKTIVVEYCGNKKEKELEKEGVIQ